MMIRSIYASEDVLERYQTYRCKESNELRVSYVKQDPNRDNFTSPKSEKLVKEVKAMKRRDISSQFNESVKKDFSV